MSSFGPEENQVSQRPENAGPTVDKSQENIRIREEVVRLVGIGKAAGILGVSTWEASKILTPTPESIPMPPEPVLRFPTGRQWAKPDIEAFKQAIQEIRHKESVQQYEAATTYRFEHITRREDILLREHFEDLAAVESRTFKNTWIRVFHKLIDGNASPTEKLTEYRVEKDTPKRFFQVREPKPLDGVIIVHRSSAEIPRYEGIPSTEPSARIYAEYGIQAGSVLDGLANFVGKEPNAKANQTTQGFYKLADYLHTQISYGDDT